MQHLTNRPARREITFFILVGPFFGASALHAREAKKDEFIRHIAVRQNRVFSGFAA